MTRCVKHRLAAAKGGLHKAEDDSVEFLTTAHGVSHRCLYWLPWSQRRTVAYTHRVMMSMGDSQGSLIRGIIWVLSSLLTNRPQRCLSHQRYNLRTFS